MEYGNGRAMMIELDMAYVSYFGDFLSKGSRESFDQNILFRLSPPRKAARPESRQAWPLRNTGTTKLSRHYQEHLRVRTQVHLRVALKYTPEYTLKYTPNCTRWHTPSLLGSTLPSSLSRGKTLSISFDYMLPCMLLHARSGDLLSCRRQAPGGVRLVTYGGQCLVGSGWRVACGRWQAEYDGRNHDIIRYHSLNLIFSVATMTRSHDTLRSWC